MNSQEMMEEIDRLARLCEAKEAEIEKLRIALRGQTCFVPPEFQQQLSEAQAQIAMQSDILVTLANLLETDGRDKTAKVIREALSATSETITAWRAKETEPLRREVARLTAALHKIIDEGDYTAPEGMTRVAKDAISADQTTALAYEREIENRGAAKALEDFAFRLKNCESRYPNTTDECADSALMMAAELRANKGEENERQHGRP